MQIRWRSCSYSSSRDCPSSTPVIRSKSIVQCMTWVMHCLFVCSGNALKGVFVFTTGHAFTCELPQTHSRLQEDDWFRRGHHRSGKFPECNGLLLSTFHRRGVNINASLPYSTYEIPSVHADMCTLTCACMRALTCARCSPSEYVHMTCVVYGPRLCYVIG